MTDPAAKKLILTRDNICAVQDGMMIVGASNKKSETEFFTFKAKLAFG